MQSKLQDASVTGVCPEVQKLPIFFLPPMISPQQKFYFSLYFDSLSILTHLWQGFVHRIFLHRILYTTSGMYNTALHERTQWPLRIQNIVKTMPLRDFAGYF